MNAAAMIQAAKDRFPHAIRATHAFRGDATVIIDEEYIGPLAYVAARGVRLPVGTHRITVERDGYFPFDTTVVADRKPIFLEIKLSPVPD